MENTNREFLEKVNAQIKEIMQDRGYITVNEVYRMLGLLEDGKNLDWNNDGYLDDSGFHSNYEFIVNPDYDKIGFFDIK